MTGNNVNIFVRVSKIAKHCWYARTLIERLRMNIRDVRALVRILTSDVLPGGVPNSFEGEPTKLGSSPGRFSACRIRLYKAGFHAAIFSRTQPFR